MSILVGMAVKSIAGGVGMVSEGASAYKANKRAKSEQFGTTQDERQVDAQDVEDEEQWALDEAQWALDEAQDDLVGTPNDARLERTDSGNVPRLADSFLRDNPPPYASIAATGAPDNTFTAPARIPYPVVLPQRRPKDRSRGFVRAYAPVLQNCGIDQRMFIDFLETFNQASMASPWLQTINLAQIGTFFLPSGIAVAVSLAIKLATDAAIEVQSRTRTNKFLDKVNDEFYRPRGLYALVMTWNPDSADAHTEINFTSMIASYVHSASEGGSAAKLKNRLRGSDGKTCGEMTFPDTAPLMFPGLDTLAARTDEKATKVKQTRRFVNDYLDRRAQAKFAFENADSTLVQGPKAKFTSRYADPAHPSNSGSLVALLTAGYVNPPGITRSIGGGHGGLLGAVSDMAGGRGPLGGRFIGASRQGYADQASTQRRPGIRLDGPEGWGTRQSSSRAGSESRGAMYTRAAAPAAIATRGGPVGGLLAEGPVGGIKKVLRKNVLYLMVVNMPTEEEMVEARQLLASRNRRGMF